MCKFWKPKLVLPHPEELPIDPDTADVYDVVLRWLVQYEVPHGHWGYWSSVNVVLKPEVQAELTYAEIKLIEVNPKYCTPGVIAHSMAHISYGQLSAPNILMLNQELERAKTEELVKYMLRCNGYGLTNNIELHAEIYRYLGSKMPKYLKQYYPGLF